MVRKVIALLWLVSFSHASSMSISAYDLELDRAFDVLSYSLNVQWDQQDQNFFNASVDAFEKDLVELQNQGLAESALMEHALARIDDHQSRDEVTAIAGAVYNSDMSSKEARAFIMSQLGGTYADGATLLLGIVLILINGADNGEASNVDFLCRSPHPNFYPCNPFGCFTSGF